MDAAEIELVRKSIENALPALAADVAGTLGNLGWDELAAAEPAVAVAELFEAQGRLVTSTAALDVVVAAAAGRPLPPGRAVVHPAPGRNGPPGQVTSEGGIAFAGLVLGGAERTGELDVPYLTPDGRTGFVTVRPAGVGAGAGVVADVGVRPVRGLDPALRLVSGTGTTARDPDPAAGQADWAAIRRAARRALAHELCGLAQRLLDDAARHVTDRHQFGRPIAAFQTVRHRLTEVSVAIASARGGLDASWSSDDPLVADAAKVLAGRAASLAGRHCLQVTGAIGFTEAHALPAALRRAAVLDALYGSGDEVRAELGRTLLARRSVPRVASLA